MINWRMVIPGIIVIGAVLYLIDPVAKVRPSLILLPRIKENENHQ